MAILISIVLQIGSSTQLVVPSKSDEERATLTKRSTLTTEILNRMESISSHCDSNAARAAVRDFGSRILQDSKAEHQPNADLLPPFQLHLVQSPQWNDNDQKIKENTDAGVNQRREEEIS